MNIAFIASAKPDAQTTLDLFTARYGQCALAQADCVVAIGGDGTVLKALHAVMAAAHQPVFAMRIAGSVGHLANALSLSDLPQRIRAARQVSIHPLQAEAVHARGTAIVQGINEIVFSRQRLQTCKIRVSSHGRHFATLVGDGMLVASPIGSSGYNRSAGGCDLQSDASLLTLTAIAPQKSSLWCNTVVHNGAVIDVEVIDAAYRPVRLETGLIELPDIVRAHVTCRCDIRLTLLFDPA